MQNRQGNAHGAPKVVGLIPLGFGADTRALRESILSQSSSSNVGEVFRSVSVASRSHYAFTSPFNPC